MCVCVCARVCVCVCVCVCMCVCVSATEQNIDIICVQKRKYYQSQLELIYHESSNGWTYMSASAWKNSVNAAIEDGGLLLTPRALKSLNSKEKIKLRMMCATFNSNPYTTIISCYSHNSANDETDITTFYNELYLPFVDTFPNKTFRSSVETCMLK